MNKFYSVNKKGHLEIAGCDAVELAQQYETPLYVLDENKIRNNCRDYVINFSKYLNSYAVAFAGKANLNIAICELMNDEKMSLDVASGGELYTALKANFPVDKIYFHGNNKTKEELNLARQNKVGRVVIDSFYEIGLLEKLGRENDFKWNVLLRITPGIKPKTHSFIQTGQIDSKFGINITKGEAFKAIQQILSCAHLNLCGLHCHIGSQIFSVDVFKLAIKVVIKLMDEVKSKFNFLLKELNIGGGLGIKYLPEDKPESIENFVKLLSQSLITECKENSFPLPKLIVEPGRSIVGDAGITLYTVGAIKEIPEVRKYVAVDGGMFENARPALYDAKYFAVIANKVNLLPSEKVSIAGKCCETGDMLIKDIELPKVQPQDILAVFSTGAYNYSMASNYNRNTRPAMILVKDGSSKLIVQRENYDDLIKNDLHLKY